MSDPNYFPLRAGRRAARSSRWWFMVPALLVCANVAIAQTLVPFTEVVDFATGDSHACAVTVAGAVKCWGANSDGQVGDGTKQPRHLPVTVIDSGAVAVDAGRDHSCALLATGTVKCWGDNGLGALGDGTTQTRSGPVDVIDLDDVIDIAVGSGHTCALRSTDDRVLCWGFNGFGQLGTGDTQNQSSPVAVATSARFVQISAGQDNVCGITTAGGVACWGVYDRRCTSFGCAFDFFVGPSGVPGLGSGMSEVSAGEYFQCALSDAGSVQCWGDNYDGQLGDLGTAEPPPFDLVAIDGLQGGVSSVDAGAGHACAGMAGGTARCWGSNSGGRLGDGTNTDRYPPVVVAGLDGASDIQAGGTFSCARNGAEDALLCWGRNDFGQLGDNDPLFRLAPTDIAGLADIVAMDAGEAHTCAVSGNGQAWCWGWNFAGQVGNGSFALEEVLVPNRVVALEDVQVSSISAGQFHSCARTTNNLAKCWGSNLDDQLAATNIGFASEPLTVPNLAGTVLATTAGGRHSCAVRTSGELRCWGDNREGQLGDGTTDDARLPVAVSSPPQSIVAAEAGDRHTCGIAPGGGVYCWGRNNVGQLGRGFTGLRSEIPLQVNGLASGVSQVSTSFEHNCVVRSGGGVSCWGLNGNGQLGDGTTTTRSEPVAVAGLPSAALHIAAGSSHTCAATQDGVYCWGSNATGQLGIGGRDLRSPGAVLNDPSLFRSGFEAGEGAVAAPAGSGRF